MFLAHAPKNASLAFPELRTWTMERLSHFTLILCFCHNFANNLNVTKMFSISSCVIAKFLYCLNRNVIHHALPPTPHALETCVKVYGPPDFGVIKVQHTIVRFNKFVKPAQVAFWTFCHNLPLVAQAYDLKRNVTA